jgi:uncharacterized membrane protein YebE (DUF533 family)
MDGMRSSWGQPDHAQQPRVDATLAGGAAGGLIGLMLGPIGTLACAALGAALGYLAYRPSASCQMPSGTSARSETKRNRPFQGGFWNC